MPMSDVAGCKSHVPTYLLALADVDLVLLDTRDVLGALVVEKLWVASVACPQTWPLACVRLT